MIFTYVRLLAALLAIASAVLYMYIDRYAPVLFWAAKRRPDGTLMVTKGKFIGHIGRVIFLIATANANISATLAHKPGSQSTLGILLGLILVFVGCVWRAAEEWVLAHPKQGKEVQ